MPVWRLIAEDPERGAEALVKEHGTRLYATAFRICQNEKDAEDLVFRTFARVVERIGSFHEQSGFFTWMCAILVNFHNMDMRRKAANALDFGEDVPERPDPRPDPSEALASNDEAAILRAAITPDRADESGWATLKLFCTLVLNMLNHGRDTPFAFQKRVQPLDLLNRIVSPPSTTGFI